MKQSIIVFIALSVCAIGASSCKSMVKQMAEHSFEYKDSQEYGAVQTRDVDVEPFSKINARGNVKVVYRQGNAQQVCVTGNEKCIDMYDITVKNNRLDIHFKEEEKDAHIRTNNIHPITLDITLPELTAMNAYGAASLNMTGTIRQSQPLVIEASGAADFDADSLYLPGLTIKVSGAGDVDMDYVHCSEDVAITVSGAGDVDGYVRCRNLGLDVSGAGDVDVRTDCREQLSVSGSGAGNIKVSGTCRTLSKQSGGVTELNLRHLKVTEK